MGDYWSKNGTKPTHIGRNSKSSQSILLLNRLKWGKPTSGIWFKTSSPPLFMVSQKVGVFFRKIFIKKY